MPFWMARRVLKRILNKEAISEHSNREHNISRAERKKTSRTTGEF